MARDPKERPEVAELIQRIENSRGSLGEHVAQLKRKIDVPSRIKHSIFDRPTAWFGGSLGVGFVASRLLRRKPKKAARKGGLIALLFSTLLTLLKPAVKGMILAELQRRFKNHSVWKNPAKETHLPLSKPQAPPSY